MFAIVTGSDGNTVIATDLAISRFQADAIAEGIRETYRDPDVRVERI